MSKEHKIPGEPFSSFQIKKGPSKGLWGTVYTKKNSCRVVLFNPSFMLPCARGNIADMLRAGDISNEDIKGAEINTHGDPVKYLHMHGIKSVSGRHSLSVRDMFKLKV